MSPPPPRPPAPPRRAAGLAVVALALACAEDAPAPAPRPPAPREAAGVPPAPAGPDPTVDQALHPELREAYALLARGEHDLARQRLRAATVPASHRHQVDFLIGVTHHEAKDYAAARPWLERALRAQPAYAPPWHFYGYCRYYLGDLEAARAAFATHLRLEPDEPDSHFGLGLVAVEEHRLDDAAARFETARRGHAEAMAKDPARAREVAKCLAWQGELAERAGALEDARARYEEALRLWPDHYEVWHKLHRVLARVGDEQGSLRALRQHDRVRDRLRPRPGS